MIGLYVKLGLAAAFAAFIGFKHLQYVTAKQQLASTRLELDHANLQVAAHEELAADIARKQAAADKAAARVEELLAQARRDGAVVRADADRVRQLTTALASRATAGGDASCERDRRDITALAGVVERSAAALERGADLAREAAARLEGCQALVSKQPADR